MVVAGVVVRVCQLIHSLEYGLGFCSESGDVLGRLRCNDVSIRDNGHGVLPDMATIYVPGLHPYGGTAHLRSDADGVDWYFDRDCGYDPYVSNPPVSGLLSGDPWTLFSVPLFPAF